MRLLLVAVGQRMPAWAEDAYQDFAKRFPPELRLELNAVKSTGAKYAVAASVDEWRYKVGLDGEPAAGVTVNIIDLSTGQVVWSGTAAKTGWSREAVSAVAQKVVDDLLKSAVNP
jgi:23S rRNA pseudoU1915 N3-methylase RlmH